MFEYIINFWSNFVKIILTLIFVISIFGFFFKKIYNHNHLRYFTFGLVASLIQLFLSLLLLFSKDFGLLNFKKQIIYFLLRMGQEAMHFQKALKSIIKTYESGGN